MAGKFNLDKPNPYGGRPYSRKYVDNDSVRMILSLHQLEMRLRKEIRREQVTVWSKEEIDRVYNR